VDKVTSDALMHMFEAVGAKPQTPAVSAALREIATSRPTPAVVWLADCSQNLPNLVAETVAKNHGFAKDSSHGLYGRAHYLLRAELASASLRLAKGLGCADVIDALAGEGMYGVRSLVAAFDLDAGIGLAARTGRAAEIGLGMRLLFSADLDDEYTAQMLVRMVRDHAIDLSSSRALFGLCDDDLTDDRLVGAVTDTFRRLRPSTSRSSTVVEREAAK
jgi:hypothetical protein